MEPLINAHDVAAMLGMSLSWVRKHTRNNDLPYYKLGHYVRYRRSDILDWLAAEGGNKRRPVPSI